jgi:hypothetical protein
VFFREASKSGEYLMSACGEADAACGKATMKKRNSRAGAATDNSSLRMDLLIIAPFCPI